MPPTLAREIAAVLDGRAYEMIFVDDASRDDTRGELSGVQGRIAAIAGAGASQECRPKPGGPYRRAGRAGAGCGHARRGRTERSGRSAAPGGADHPRRRARQSRAWSPATRAKRQDRWSKRAASRDRQYHAQRPLKDGADDSGSGIKVFKREAFLRLPYFDHMHRFMAALMLREGYAVEFLEVNHRHRGAGRSKYTNLGRLAANMTDLFGVMWLRSRARLPGGADEL